LFFVGSYLSKTQSSFSSPPPPPPPTVSQNNYHQRHRSSTDYHQYDTDEAKLNKHSSNYEILRCISSQPSSSKSRSGLSDNEDHEIPSSLPKYITNGQKCSRSYPLSRQSSKENKKHFCNSNYFRTNSNRSRLSAPNQGVYRIDRHRRKALKLLIVIILEFFICWTPLFIFHTYGTFDKNFYRSMPTIFIDLILLFSFASPLCNPFTYYFMSKRYRAVLYAYIPCCYSNEKKEKFNQKNQDAQQIIKALHLHQQQNSLEYKQKFNQQKISSPNHLRYYQKFRSNTFQ
jgi:hypothetical protein